MEALRFTVERNFQPESAPELSLVAPLHDEEANVGAFLDEVARVLRRWGRSFEIVCVDDCSSDRTLSLLRGHLPVLPELRVLSLPRQAGQSAALAAGIAASTGRLVALMDADLQNDPADLPLMIRRLQADSDLAAVVGFRQERRDSWLRRISSRIANSVARLILPGVTVRDAGCALKVVRGTVLRGLPRFRGMHRFLVPLIQRADGRVFEVPVNHRERRHGRSKYGGGLRRTFIALRDAIGVRWLMSRSIASEPIELRRP